MDQIYLITHLAFTFILISSAFTSPNVFITLPQTADKEFQNQTILTVTNAHAQFDLHCSASYPIQWVGFYEPDDDGTSESKKWAETRRIVEKFDNIATYSYSAVLSLAYAGKLQIFANFSCQSIQNPQVQTNVITRSTNRKNVLILEITGKKLLTQENSRDNRRCDIFVVASDLDENKKRSCWKCETNAATPIPLELDFYTCETPIECNLYYQTSNRGTSCLRVLPGHENNTECKRSVKDYNPRILACKNQGIGLVQFFYFSVAKHPGKARIIYFNWNDIDPQEMIYVHPIKDELYAGQNITIICEVSRFYFSYGIWFATENEAGSGNVNFIKGMEPASRVETGVDSYNRNGTFRANLTIALTKNLKRVWCFAPVWNSQKWVNDSVVLNVQEGEAPMIISDRQGQDSKAEFIVGEQNKTLRCNIRGKPSPEISWSGPPGSDFIAENDPINGWSQIRFKEITHTLEGEYICLAKSFIGSDSKKFKVLVSDNQSASIGIILGVIIPIAMILLVIIFLGWRKIRQQRIALRILTEKEIQEFVEGNPKLVKNNEYLNAAPAMEALSYNRSKYEIPKEYLKIDMSSILGSGAFGVVYKGTIHKDAQISTDFQNITAVAVKTVKSDVDVDNFKALLLEIKIMAYLGHHKNLVNLIGANTENIRNRQAYIAVELCEKGSLENYLRNNQSSFVNYVEYGELKPEPQKSRWSKGPVEYDNVIGQHVTTFDITKWAYDIALGMEYLHERKVIHGDLAIRNVLLNADAVAKIGDFGLSRQLVNSSNYFKKTHCPLPWKWMAPESLQELQFSPQSDIWAFGVTLWEIYSLGEIPLKGLALNNEFMKELLSGFRMDKPLFATNHVYEFMRKCWNYEPKERPGFEEFKRICVNMLKDVVPDDYFEEPMAENINKKLQSPTELPDQDMDGYEMPNKGPTIQK